MTEPAAGRGRRSPRPWVVPPGLLACAEPFDGFEVLDELRSGVGLLLWQCLRDAGLWAATPADRRAGLFAPGALGRRRERIHALAGEAELRGALETLAEVLDGRGAPAGEELAAACTAVSAWAGGSGLPRIALAFAQGAATASPGDAAPAYAVGLLARRAAEHRRAETWFRRTLALARRAGDWEHYGLACVGLGNLYRQRGDHPSARGWFFKSLRVARRHGLWAVRPLALHDLFCVAAAAGPAAEAEAWARRAFRAYGRGHPRLVALAHDVARFWLLQGHPGRALPVFRAVLPHLTRLPERRLAAANTARAAAGAGDRMTFASMWSEAWRLVDDFEDTEGVAEALLVLAQGAAALGDPDRGQLAAGHALKVAAHRGEQGQRLAAESLLEELRGVRTARVSRAPLPAAPPAEPPVAGTLLTDLVDALTAKPPERMKLSHPSVQPCRRGEPAARDRRHRQTK